MEGPEQCHHLQNFYPRPPRGGRQYTSELPRWQFRFLSTPSARRATDRCQEVRASGQISIHALREEGDSQIAGSARFLPISIHALREEGDPLLKSSNFQPNDFYPRPPRGGRPPGAWQFEKLTIISIHALREEGDFFWPSPRLPSMRFLSTPSARRATLTYTYDASKIAISIHALREEGDGVPLQKAVVFQEFLSTPSARRATTRFAGSRRLLGYFYPRPPRGGRQQKRRKTSPLLFHYKTICTDLEELVQKHPKKQL